MSVVIGVRYLRSLLDIYARLGVSDRAAAVAEAFGRGLLARQS
jgi:hypothetical protein